MFDHVGVYSSDYAATRRGLLAALGAMAIEPDSDRDGLVEWDDLAMSPVDADHEATRNVHIGLLAPGREAIEAFWRAGRAAGLADDGAPGPREQYGEGYLGAFLRDADGNSIEACRHPNSVDGSVVDHVWLRVADLAASRDFYLGLAEWTGFALAHEQEGYARFRGPGASFSLVAGEPVSVALHMAFPTDDDAVVDAFHAAALRAGHRDNGAPGPRAQYHPGYFGAFVLDPDGHNIEVVNHHR